MDKRNRLTDPDKKPRDIRRSMVDAVYGEALAYDEGLFEHLGFHQRPTLEEFRSRYLLDDGEVDFSRLMDDAWSFEPMATRWRARNEARGDTPEKYLHGLADLVGAIEQNAPHLTTELQQARELCDQILANNPIRKH